MELPNASSIDSYPSDQQSDRSITSIGDSALEDKPFPPISFARNSKMVESLPSIDADPHRFVTSIEYLADDPEIAEAGNYDTGRKLSENLEYGFIQKAAIDRNKLFKLHYNIQQPEQQLVEETLGHFQKRSLEVPKQLKVQELVLPVHRKDSNVTESSKNENKTSAVAKGKKTVAKISGVKQTKVPAPTVRQEKVEALNIQQKTSSLPLQKGPSQRSHPSLHDKENIRPEQHQRLSARPMTHKLKTILQGLRTQEKPPACGEKASIISQTPGAHNNTIPEEESICVCDEILARLEESNLGLEAGLFKEVMNRLNTVSRQIQGFESQFRSLKSENQHLREKLMAIEANKSSVKTSSRVGGKTRLLLRPQDSNNFAFKTHTSTHLALTARKAESEYRLQNTALVQDRTSHYSVPNSEAIKPLNFANSLNKKVMVKNHQLKVTQQVFEPRMKRRASHHSGLSIPFA